MDIKLFNNGIKIQYGFNGNNGTNLGTITFPIAHYSLKYSVVISDWSSNHNAYYVGVDVSNRQKTSIKIYMNAARGYTWISIGY